MTRTDRLSTVLIDTLAENGPSPASVELHEAITARAREMRARGLAAGHAVSELRALAREILAPRVTSFALERSAHIIVGDITRWCLNEYYRPRPEQLPSIGDRALGAPH